MKRRFSYAVLLALVLIITMSCLGSSLKPESTHSLSTAVVLTVEAYTTQTALALAGSPAAPPTAAPQSTVPPTSTNPLPAATLVRCNQASFVADVTVPDGTEMMINTSFVKTWRIKNTGTCTWTTAYHIVYSSGAQLGAAAAINFPGTVPPGATVDLSVPMNTLSVAGQQYTGYFKFRSDAGIEFGLGPGDVPVSVVISTGAALPPVSAPPSGEADLVFQEVSVNAGQKVALSPLPVKAKATVCNNGGVVANNVEVAFYGGVSETEPTCSATIGSIMPGACKTEDICYYIYDSTIKTYNQYSEYGTARFRIDPYDIIVESRKDNNWASYTVKFK